MKNFGIHVFRNVRLSVYRVSLSKRSFGMEGRMEGRIEGRIEGADTFLSLLYYFILSSIGESSLSTWESEVDKRVYITDLFRGKFSAGDHKMKDGNVEFF